MIASQARPRRPLAFTLVILLLVPAGSIAETDHLFTGRPLQEALLELRAGGLNIVFSTRVVRPDMVVAVEPTAGTRQEVLAELLSPHGLEAREEANGTLVVVRAANAPPTPMPLVPFIEEEIVVTPSHVSLLYKTPSAGFGLTREELMALPHLGDDFFRALSLLPGITANDITAQFNVRGGRRDETQIVLDGQELYDAYHLKDFDNALSIVASDTLDTVDLSTGGFPVEYGDRMGGVLDMVTTRPTGRARGRAGLSIWSADLGGSGTFREERGSWIAQARRGSTDLAGQLFTEGKPTYWDVFGKLDFQLNDRNRLRGNLLYSDDSRSFSEVIDTESKSHDTRYRATYLWATHEALIGTRLFLASAVSFNQGDRDRRGLELEEDIRFAVRDERDLTVLNLRQDWSYQAAPAHSLRWGFAANRYETTYDYTSTVEYDNPLAGFLPDPDRGTSVFESTFENDHDGLYLIDRFQPAEPLTLELGLRWDRHTSTDETLLSPRFNLAWAPRDGIVIRVAWGEFNQSQRPYELQVADGETEIQPVETSQHWVVGFERHFVGRSGRPGPAVRVEIYRRDIENPRPRYENLWEPINVFPEVQPDRYRFAPERSEAKGVEVFVRGRPRRRVNWWLNYTFAYSDDLIAGDRVPRRYDERHKIGADLDLLLGRGWNLNLAWRFHTGWPTTAVTIEPVSGGVAPVRWVPVLGLIYGGRLPSYNRLDLRVSRRWKVGPGMLTAYLDVQNALDRGNVAGYDIEIDEEEGELIILEEVWPGLLPSIGVAYEF